jgi:hypothetical protein
MKNFLKLFGVIALAAVIGLAMGCKTDDDDGSNFNGTWKNESDAADIINIESPNWTRTKGNVQAGTLDFANAPSSAEPNILDGTGGNIGWAKINGGKLEWGISGSGTTTFAK